MNKKATTELITGIVLSILGVPSKGGIIKMICNETLCSPEFTTNVFNGCWYCTLVSLILLISGIGLIILAIKEWSLNGSY